jgi:general secretion pathway protein J
MMRRIPEAVAGRGRSAGEKGFTLLEVVVALVVLGFILAGLAQAAHFGMSAWGLETRYADNAAELERVDRVIRDLIEQAAPAANNGDKPFAGQEHRLLFITELPDEPEDQPVRRAQVSIGVDDKHRLVMRWQPDANATPLMPLPPPKEIVLAEGLERIDLAYRQAASDGGKWSKVWTDSPLPALVQIHFVLANGKHKWPDMAVPTTIDTNGSF